MKKILTAVLTLSCATAIFAGGIDNKSNLSTGYLRNPSRATETKRPEAVLYNIGGTSFMEDGLAFTIGNQFIFKEYTNELNGTEYKENKTVLFFPDVEAVYKKDRWAAFGGFGVFAGGGSLDYKDGTAATFLALYGATSSPAIAKKSFPRSLFRNNGRNSRFFLQYYRKYFSRRRRPLSSRFFKYETHRSRNRIF